MKTIGPKSHTNIPASRRSRCADSNHPSKPNDFYPCTVRFKTCSELVATISEQLTIDSSEGRLFLIGERRLAYSEESWICSHLRKIMALIALT